MTDAQGTSAGGSGLPPREAALALLHEFTASESLRKHAYAVEAVMRAYARRFAAEIATGATTGPSAGVPASEVDEHYWGLVGLLHDFDYERFPEVPEHATEGAKILAERGWPEDFRRAILSHADYTGVPRERLVERTLFAVDELSGFLTAVALVKPSKSLAEVDARSVRKKLKDKAFARSVNRDDVVQGPAQLGVDFDEHCTFMIAAMSAIAGELGL
jgi:predicted hydrolase (HD superfamily)